MFKVAIRKNMQGVAYLLLQNGFDLMTAIQDAMDEKKFKYVWTLLNKVSDDNIIRKPNQKGQNLFHTFAIQGSQAPLDLTQKIHKTFVNKGIDFKIQDSEGRTPLHYAAENNFNFLVNELLNSGVNPNIQDKKGFTPFTLQLIKGTINEITIQNYIKHNVDLTLRFKAKIKKEEIEIGPLNYLVVKGTKNLELLKLLIHNGVSVNERDENGRTPLMNAILNNSKKLVKFFLGFPGIDKNQKDEDGRNPIHLVVKPMEFASYENTEILELLAPHFDINAVDEQQHTPIYYAYLQDSGVMANKLKELGAKDNKPAAHIKRAATSIIASISWNEEIDYEEDAEQFLKKAIEAEKDVMKEETNKVLPDSYITNPEQYEVVYDDKLGYYDLEMTKVDIQQGPYGGYRFYKMQVVRQTNRDVYVLFTRWGRVGDPGQYQQTPFATKELAIEEFKKIFKSKSGNDWENKDNFQKQPKKYQLLTFTKRTNHKEYLVPFNLKDPHVPKSHLDKEIRRVVEDIANVKMYQSCMRNYHIDTDYLPLANLTKSLLTEAQQILVEIRELQEECQEERKKEFSKQDADKILEIQDKIAEKSSRFYELIPSSLYRNCAVPSIDDPYKLKNMSDMLSSLLEFEVSSKILLGALNNVYKINPLDYCFNALNIRMLRLPEENPEYQLIKEYVFASHPARDDYIMNIFCIERKGEAERISQWAHLKNRMLLWHGSKVSNFMGILSQGLRIAPPEAPATGYMFGKGVYFADMFTKSLGYCTDDGTGYKLLLLCEVALGEMYETEKAEYITELKAPYKSVKGIGREGPKMSKKVVLSNGCICPIGKIVNYKKDQQQPFMWYGGLQHNEYIVYDVSQIRMRYLVQVKILS